VSFPNSQAFVLWKPHDDIVIVPKNCHSPWREERLSLKNRPSLKHLKAIAVTPNEDQIVYILSKHKPFQLRHCTTLYIRKIEYSNNGVPTLGARRKAILRHPFEAGSTLTISSHDDHEIRCFVSHSRGAVEAAVFNQAFPDTPLETFA